MDKRTPEKKERVLSALDRGMTMIHLDARRAGVIVPEHLRQEMHLLLNLSYRFEPPDLTVGEWGLRSTLTFAGQRFTVAVPWSALYAISSQVTKEFWIYPDDMPRELLEEARLTSKVPLGEGDGPWERSQSMLREVAGEKPREQPEDPKPRGRGHLRLVK